MYRFPKLSLTEGVNETNSILVESVEQNDGIGQPGKSCTVDAYASRATSVGSSPQVVSNYGEVS